MKSRFIILAVFGLLISHLTQAAMISNGDFQTCDFTGWQQDVDGLGPVAGSPDFSIINNAGDCSAQLFVDDLDTASAMIANTLFTHLDLTAQANETLSLSFDWVFEGTDGDPDFGDYFLVFLGDGSGTPLNEFGMDGLLIDAISEYGAGSFSIALDASLNNMPDLTLEFQLNDAFSGSQDILFSTLNIDNVQLSANSVPVNGPYSLGLFIAALALLRRRATRV